MEFVELSRKEFDDFASKNKYESFFQTSAWGVLKEKNNWKYEFLGLKDNNKIVAATLLLSKNTVIKKKMFYAPRGFLLDYENTKVLEAFIDEIKKYVKKNKGLFIKIDPYVVKNYRDKEGQVIEPNKVSFKVLEVLKNKGFKEQNKKEKQQTLQAKWMYVIDLEDKTIEDLDKDMTSKTRQMIRKNEKNGIVLREGSYDDLEEFNNIMNHTSERRGFLNRDADYYQEMYKEFGDGKYVKLYFADLEIEKKLNELKETKEKDFSFLMKDIELGKKKMKESTLEQKKKEIETIKEQIDKYKELYDKHGSKLVLGAILYFLCGNEVLSFVGGAYKDYMEFQPFYTIHYEMIKYAKENNYKYYNFYTVSSNLKPNDPTYGVYLFKKGFGGGIIELLGEFDLKTSNMYILYKIAYSVVHKLKKLKVSIRS